MIAFTVLQFAIWPSVNTYELPRAAPGGTSQQGLAILAHEVTREGTLALILVCIGYGLFVTFFAREGARFFKAHAEMRLAGEIHKALVPRISSRIGRYEFYGHSAPSGQVGGDLVDLVEGEGGWISYLADVSGHGVPAGVLMAMVKSAARMRLQRPCQPGEFLQELNHVLLPLTADDSFVTFGCVCSSDEPSRLIFSLAGHLPILHYRPAAGAFEEHDLPNLPLGINNDARFDSSQIQCQPGDLLAILTDGFTEITDGKNEIGLEGVKRMLGEMASQPLPAILEHVRQKSHEHGPQADDQTLLLIRFLPDSTPQA